MVRAPKEMHHRFAILGDAEILAGLETSAILLPGVATDWLAHHESHAVTLRPDRYVFALARDRAALEAHLRSAMNWGE